MGAVERLRAEGLDGRQAAWQGDSRKVRKRQGRPGGEKAIGKWAAGYPPSALRLLALSLFQSRFARRFYSTGALVLLHLGKSRRTVVSPALYKEGHLTWHLPSDLLELVLPFLPDLAQAVKGFPGEPSHGDCGKSENKSFPGRIAPLHAHTDEK